jgi:hypothetical protein
MPIFQAIRAAAPIFSGIFGRTSIIASRKRRLVLLNIGDYLGLSKIYDMTFCAIE